MSAAKDDAERDRRDHVRWHDLECGGYTADLELWRGLAGRAPDGRILDAGAGTGRVALDLARAGRAVLAIDSDPVLVDELARRARARRLPVEAVEGDLRDPRTDEAFALVVVPMQTVQLRGGAEGRGAFLTALPAMLAPGALAAISLVEAPEPFDPEDAVTVPPDMRDHAGTVYASRPVRVAVDERRIVLDRVREIVSVGGRRSVTEDHTVLDVVTADELEAEARHRGLAVHPRLEVAATEEHVASHVVVLGA